MANDDGSHPIATVAALLDLTERRVQQLTAEGVIPRIGHGRYNLPMAVRGYIKYLRERAVQGDPKGADEVGVSRAALLKARARMATLEADQAEGQLLKRSDVEKAWTTIISAMRTRLLAIPSSTAQAIVYLNTAPQIATMLTNAIGEALDDIANLPVYTDADQGGEAIANGRDPRQPEGGEVAADPVGVAMGGSEADAQPRGVG
jgi:phage terminase Nu1 subunit (DNA packaging protein)